MSESLGERLARASEHVDAPLGPEALSRGLRAVEHRIVKKRRQKRALQGMVGALACGALVLFAATRPSAERRIVTTHDGSQAAQLAVDTELAVERDSDDEVALRLDRGKGHFEVTKRPKRRYRVRAGAVEVVVLGTGFDVERLGERTRVAVAHGLVRVQWDGGSTLLRAGDTGTFPPDRVTLEAAVAPPEPVVASSAVAAEPAPQEPREAPTPERWRALARAGKHAEAFSSLGARAVDDLAGLLLAADAARLSSHSREAARHLERLVKRYPKSPEARLAAFTLGRLALNELRAPRLAARSFARAYALDPHGPLAEDALVREAEAYDRAGDAQRAKSTAERYLQRFPAGSRRGELARYLGAAP